MAIKAFDEKNTVFMKMFFKTCYTVVETKCRFKNYCQKNEAYSLFPKGSDLMLN